MSQLFARVHLDWLSPAQGGRQTPLAGGRYTPTARFAGTGLYEQFSVVLQLDASHGSSPAEGWLDLLNPDLVEVRARIRTGTRLEIMEGARKVADCVVTRLEPVAEEAITPRR